jgi:hypothetical protein
LPAGKHRKLQSKYTECRKTYIEAAFTPGQAHNLFDRLRLLLTSKQRDDVLIETLDHLLGECCTIGEKRCTKTRGEWFSRKINHLRLRRRILQKKHSAFMNTSEEAFMWVMTAPLLLFKDSVLFST